MVIFFLLVCDIYSYVYYGNVHLKMNFSLCFEHFGNVFTLKGKMVCGYQSLFTTILKFNICILFLHLLAWSIRNYYIFIFYFCLLTLPWEFIRCDIVSTMCIILVYSSSLRWFQILLPTLFTHLTFFVS